MNKSYRTAIVLVVVLLALVGIAQWDEWKTKKDEVESKNKNKIVQFEQAEVVSLRYRRTASDLKDGGSEKGGEPESAAASQNAEATDLDLAMSFFDDKWRIKSPIDFAGDEKTVSGLLESIAGFQYEEVVNENKESWANYGLAPAQREIVIGFKADKRPPLTIFIGKKAPVGYGAYISTSESSKAYIGSQFLVTSTAKELRDFRDKSFVKLAASKVKEIDYLVKGKPPIKIVRQEGKFRILSPEENEADQEAVNSLINELNDIKVSEFFDRPTTDQIGLLAKGNALASLAWTQDTGERTEILFADNLGTLLATFDPAKMVYKLPETFKTQVQKEFFDFRNKRVFHFSAMDVAEIDIDGEVYRREEGAWYKKSEWVEKKDSKPSTHEYLTGFVSDVENVKSDRFIKIDDPILNTLKESPKHKVMLTLAAKADDKSAPLNFVFELFKADNDDKFYLKAPGAPVVYRVSKEVMKGAKPQEAVKKAETAVPAGPEDVLQEHEEDIGHAEDLEKTDEPDSGH